MTPVRVVTTKWGGRPHWEFDALLLGSDEHGEWVGLPIGTSYARPGRELVSTNRQVTLLPRDGWWAATFHDPAGAPLWAALDDTPLEVYVDVATPAEAPEPGLRTLVDLDLDVIRGATGIVVVDDENEFAEHRVAYGYPAEVVAAARASCDVIRAALEARTPPFDGDTAARWLAQLTGPGR